MLVFNGTNTRGQIQTFEKWWVKFSIAAEAKLSMQVCCTAVCKMIINYDCCCCYCKDHCYSNHQTEILVQACNMAAIVLPKLC